MTMRAVLCGQVLTSMSVCACFPINGCIQFICLYLYIRIWLFRFSINIVYLKTWKKSSLGVYIKYEQVGMNLSKFQMILEKLISFCFPINWIEFQHWYQNFKICIDSHCSSQKPFVFFHTFFGRNISEIHDLYEIFELCTW